ncbi:alpha/beta hydrolase family protein [Sandarakinorhabdus oryzae]|uniref:alpha/beta hydrolase family protein n=1 Tax=Sandarakinorhabdus oryzae TaxID=2675220 RepID=UPI0012E2079E|nr:dienelactone hydrolase [Sandarakinorhabdus oryzae]
MKSALALLALLIAAPAAAVQCDAIWRDGPRGRDLPVRIDLPDGKAKLPAVIWSPGLGGIRSNASRWVAAWNAAGIAVVRLEHPGSDAAVYRGAATPAEREARVRAGIAPEQLLARVADVGFVADELARRPREGACDLTRIDEDRLALAGHSMGAWVVQAMAGQHPDGEHPLLIDRRFRAFIAMSSTGPTDAVAARAQFGGIGRPLLVITGSRDGVPANASPEAIADTRARRLSLFVGASADGRKALADFDGADHLLFAGDTRKLPADTQIQTRVAAITTLWWRQWLLGDARAGKALAKPPLAKADQWVRK